VLDEPMACAVHGLQVEVTVALLERLADGRPEDQVVGAGQPADSNAASGASAHIACVDTPPGQATQHAFPVTACVDCCGPNERCPSTC
jgi:hypothetical protein